MTDPQSEIANRVDCGPEGCEIDWLASDRLEVDDDPAGIGEALDEDRLRLRRHRPEAESAGACDLTSAAFRCRHRLHGLSRHSRSSRASRDRRRPASAADVANVVSRDPAVSTNILRIVNSAYYGLQVRVSSVSLAISVMGFNMTKKVALRAAVFSAFGKRREKIQHFDPVAFWKHAIYTGVTAKVLGTADLNVVDALGRIEGTGSIQVNVDNAGTISPGSSATAMPGRESTSVMSRSNPTVSTVSPTDER